MQRTSSMGWIAVAALALIAGCGDGGGTTDAGGGLDAGGSDASAGDGGGAGDAGGGSDAGGDDGGASDGGASDAGGLDGGGPDAGGLDAGGLDAGGSPDAGAANACVLAGGTCEALVPGACAAGIVGNADWYSCGGGLGVLCCLPPRTPPSCRNVGSRSEGWYRADGERICFATCDGATLMCEAIGTRSEGWYADPASAACAGGPVMRLVEWTDCGG